MKALELRSPWAMPHNRFTRRRAIANLPRAHRKAILADKRAMRMDPARLQKYIERKVREALKAGRNLARISAA